MVARRGQPSLGHDPGKRTGWEYRAVSGIDKPDYARGYYQAGATFFTLMRRAAKHRGISGGAYLRRAVAAFIARDLDLTLAEVLKDSPSASWEKHRDEKTGTWRREFDDGTGFGTWEAK